MWQHLNQSTIDQNADEALRRVLGHLGHYVNSIVRPLNLRPVAAEIHSLDRTWVEVRISSSTQHIVVVIGPDAEMAAMVFWLRQMAQRNLPAGLHPAGRPVPR